MIVGLLPNPVRFEQFENLASIINLFHDRGVEVAMSRDQQQLVPQEVQVSWVENKVEMARKSDVLLSLGGDGTLLHTARLDLNKLPPVLGVNFGRLGFLSGIELAALPTKVDRLISGDYTLEKRMMLEARIGSRIMGHCLNEAAVGKGIDRRMCSVEVRVNGDLVERFYGDGIVVSTPTGSTAYSMACGGPILIPSMEAMIVTPICAQSLSTRPIVLPADDIVELEIDFPSDKPSLILDGQRSWSLRNPTSIRVVKSRKFVNLVRFEEQNFFKLLREKLQMRGSGLNTLKPVKTEDAE